MKWMRAFLVFAGLLGGVHEGAAATTLLSANFDDGEDGFVYCDDPFGTNEPGYAAGVRVATGGYGDSGALQTTLGGIGSIQTAGASGGWCHAMTLAAPASNVTISLRYKLKIDHRYFYDEYSRLLIAVDGQRLRRGQKTYIDHLGGTTSTYTFDPDTDWQQVVIHVDDLDAGTHQWQIGVYNNMTQNSAAQTLLLVDDVVVTSDNPPPSTSAAQTLVDRLDLVRFKADIETLSSFGDRLTATPRFLDAQAWVADRLREYGYEVEYQTSDGAPDTPISNVYVTKVGRQHPDRMYILGAHLDGRGNGGAADDDGSGVALVMEIARVLAAPDIETDTSIRMILFDSEEDGYRGSSLYVAKRRPLQGVEDPPGSGAYPEPTWLGMLQHDMLLYDHGIGPDLAQSPYADMDVEWDSAFSNASARALASAWHHAAGEYAADYPSTPNDQGRDSDDRSFTLYVASISVRENRRGVLSEWINPNYHAATDVYSAYSDDDFKLGFNAVQATIGTIATLAGARISPPDEIFPDGFDAASAP